MRGGHNRKVTAEQREHLLQVHLHLGLAESRALCLEYGVGPNFAAKYASSLDLTALGPAAMQNIRRGFWTEEKRAELTTLAATGMIAVDIGLKLGTTQDSVITFAGRNGIAIVRYSPEQQAIYDARKKERDSRKHRRKAIIHREKKIADRAAAMARAGFTPSAVKSALSKTSVTYRKQLRPVGEMSKNQLRAMLADAAANTASLHVGEALV